MASRVSTAARVCVKDRTGLTVGMAEEDLDNLKRVYGLYGGANMRGVR